MPHLYIILTKNTTYLSFECTSLFCLVIASGGISCQRLKPTSILKFKPIKLDGNVVYMQKPTFNRTCKNPTSSIKGVCTCKANVTFDN